jgi:2-oxoglutarate ferredoxin oxidoreductase subunit beta
MGYPIKMTELLNTLEAPAFLARVSVHDPKNINKAKEAIKKAFEYQIQGKGFSMVEVLSTCPTNWGLAPLEALKWLEANMIPQFPLGVARDREGVAQ